MKVNPLVAVVIVIALFVGGFVLGSHLRKEDIAEPEKPPYDFALDKFLMSELSERLNTFDPLTVLEDDLKSKPNLIPYAPVLGGTMMFYGIRVLNDRWVFASFEDGHIAGSMLLSYAINEDAEISWEVVASYLV